MKVMWSYDGKESKTRVIVRDDNKICSECSGYLGHFVDCKIFLKEKQEGKYD